MSTTSEEKRMRFNRCFVEFKLKGKISCGQGEAMRNTVPFLDIDTSAMSTVGLSKR